MPVAGIRLISSLDLDQINHMMATEPTTGIEPVTYHLQGDCSTIELRRQVNIFLRYCHEIIPKANMKDKVWILP
jgi:hypothetical protein